MILSDFLLFGDLDESGFKKKYLPTCLNQHEKKKRLVQFEIFVVIK